MKSLAVFLLLNSATLASEYPRPQPIQWLLQAYSRSTPQILTDKKIEEFGQHISSFNQDPNIAFGNSPNLFNTRSGDAPGMEIYRHDDEPIVMGEATMESSSESGSDGEETEEDKRNYREALKKADSYAQVQSFAQRGEFNERRIRQRRVNPAYDRQNIQLYDFDATQGLVQQKSINNEQLFNDILEPTKVESSKNQEARSFAQDLAELNKAEIEASPEFQANLAKQKLAQE